MPSRRARGQDPAAEPLHRHALRLLRLLRREDEALGVSAARLSALSVLVFGGPMSLGALAEAEQVSAPTMTRLAQELEREGWARREVADADARRVRLSATPAAMRLLRRGRDGRLDALSAAIDALAPDDRKAIGAALPALDRLVQVLQQRASDARGDLPSRTGRRRLD